MEKDVNTQSNKKNTDEIIINVPEQLSKTRVGTETTLKVVLNFILVSFVVIATIALWGFSSVYLYERLFTPEYMMKTYDILFNLTIFALVAFLSMFMWQQYNYRVFGRRKRRAFPDPVPDAQIAGMHNTTVEDIQKLRRAKIVWLERQGKEGTPEEVRICRTDKDEVATMGPLNINFKLPKENTAQNKPEQIN